MSPERAFPPASSAGCWRGVAHHSVSFQISGWSAPASAPISAKMLTATLSCAIAASMSPDSHRRSARLVRNAASRCRSPWATQSVRPEQRGQRIARLRLARHGQIGKQRDGFAGIHGHRSAIALDARRAEEKQRHLGHRSVPPDGKVWHSAYRTAHITTNTLSCVIS